MPDIREPYPVKPVWPTRPGRSIGEKQTPKTDKDKEEKQKKRKPLPDEDGPHIDDYA
ncbi:MAG: hypothetical protein GY814_12345 [Gammaproteobacteria bacterium]|nr:hypothetical protein [Gammaproteobacteria bacterium]